MRVLIVNPILYTSETRDIKKVNTIKDTMIYDLCLGFMEKGVDVTLAAAGDFKPVCEEEYPFEVVWFKTRLKKIFPPNNLPFCPDLMKYVEKHHFDLIITSEVFSLNSLMLSVKWKDRLIVWHELGKHNKMMHQIPSKIWYNIVARLFFKDTEIVPRSKAAKDFISQFCNNVSDTIIDHGVNLEKFQYETEKENYFAISSQLIERKRIDKIISAFADYLNNVDSTCKLYIMGDGEEKDNLVALANNLGISDSVIFTGKLSHDKLVDILKKAMAMLVYTRKDNNMVSVVESIALATPVVTTSVPYNAEYIEKYNLGIVDDNWDFNTLRKIANDKSYISNCLDYRSTLSTAAKAEKFIEISRTL
ncbi:MAG: glycosyltransferase [Eubacteriales bacterium]|nr:glycosyltransferase [Eubacteriales bacterium]